jgi:hypothetical protein
MQIEKTKSEKKMKLVKELAAKNVKNPTICCVVVA